jgi:Holliday junction resolvase YEN1
VRVSLAKLSSNHYSTYSRPFRLAIDISIWLFQIQSCKGGSNPALRTFYYRLLRLLSLNIHPLFVFDGPNKPLFKRNKKVGGPGVRVASVPEFLAKQLLKQFSFPWHVAPGEAEAECALLQREKIVDAVLSEDVDTLMFGSGVTLRNWTPEGGSAKTPTHVNVYRAEETLAVSGLDGQGMVLVALMSGGDYIPEGIPGCGPKLACDAARAGFGRELCNLRKSDKEGLKTWRERLQHEIRTNESKLFSRKNPKLVIPDDFPSAEVMGYYTRPCISSALKLAQLRDSLKWDQDIDFPALRSFTGDAFDWRCVGGAKKFIRNLAPAMLVRRLRMIAEAGEELDPEAQAVAEAALVMKVHGKRNHKTTDGELEMRISFTPSNMVPIDLSIEDEEDDFLLAGQDHNDSEPEDGVANVPSETPTEASDAEEAPTSPAKKTRQAKPYDPDAADKLWILKDFLQLGCPLIVEDYEASLRNPKETVKAKRKATAASGAINIQAPKPRAPRKMKAAKTSDMPANALMRHMQVTKSASIPPVAQPSTNVDEDREFDYEMPAMSGFKLPSAQVSREMMRKTVPNVWPSDDFFASLQAAPTRYKSKETEDQRTPKKSNKLKRPSADFSTPRVGKGRADITAYFSPTPKVKRTQSQGELANKGVKQRSTSDIIDLLSSSPMQDVPPRDASPTPRPTRYEDADDILPPLPGTVTKRRKTRGERGPLRKSLSAPVHASSPLFVPGDESSEMDLGFEAGIEPIDTAHEWQPSPSLIHHDCSTSNFQSRLTNARAEHAICAPIFHFSSSQHSLPTPPAETTSPVPLPSPRPGPGADYVLTAGGFIFEKQPEQFGNLTTPYPTANPEQSTQPKPFAKPAPETITLSSSPMAPPPPPPSHQNPPQTAPTPKSKPKPEPKLKPKKPKSKALLLRDSLPGTWRAATDEEAEALDLTGDGSGVRKESGGQRGKKSAWRTSGVEVLDLTGG